jgi:hypothetical protein
MNRETRLKDYYKSPYWKKFVKEILSPNDTVCEICGCKRWKINRKGEKKINRVFNIHHINYNHLNKETRGNVQILCRRCHQLSHDILKIASDTESIQSLKDAVRRFFIYVG